MAGKERSGTALGLENTMVFAGAFLTPPVIPGILSATDWPVVMLLIGAVPAVLSAVGMPPRGEVAARPVRRTSAPPRTGRWRVRPARTACGQRFSGGGAGRPG